MDCPLTSGFSPGTGGAAQPVIPVTGQQVPARDLPDAGEVRRPPYGRNPALAAHGVRARSEIVEAARELFKRNGYQATTVESIGEATGRSGAAVYQYFEGKAEIFGIFLREGGGDLIAVGERFPVLTDDTAGRHALQRWISTLMDVLDRHEMNFRLWPQIQFAEPSLALIGHWNLSHFTEAVAKGLQAAKAHPPTPNITPLGMLSVLQWSFFMWHARDRKFPRERLERALATTLHADLFSRPEPVDEFPVAAEEVEKIPSIPLGDALGLRRPLTARGVGTVQRILLAAADRFRETGFYGTSLSDVATAARVSHGSVYTYWADRDALFATLATDALSAIGPRVDALAEALRTPAGLYAWLDGWMSMLVTHGAVLFVWLHEVDAPDLADLTAQMNSVIDRAAAAFVESSANAPQEDPEALGVVLRALLTDVPYVLSVQLEILGRAATCAFIAGLLRSGVGARFPSAG